MFSTKSSVQRVLKESQSILSISYVIAIGIGMLFTYHKYAVFGINIFDYAGVFDFLMAPFADFSILFFTVFSLVATYCIVIFDNFYQKHFPKEYAKMNFGLDRKAWYQQLRKVISLLFFLFYLFFSAVQYGKISKRKVQQQASVQIEFIDQQTKTGKVIGKTKEVIFLLHQDQVEIIPITSSVRQIVLVK